MDNKYYFLDPDNRKKIPHEKHCERCKKIIKDISRTLRISYEERQDTCPFVRLDETGEYLIGKDCWNKITEQ